MEALIRCCKPTPKRVQPYSTHSYVHPSICVNGDMAAPYDLRAHAQESGENCMHYVACYCWENNFRGKKCGTLRYFSGNWIVLWEYSWNLNNRLCGYPRRRLLPTHFGKHGSRQWKPISGQLALFMLNACFLPASFRKLGNATNEKCQAGYFYTIFFQEVVESLVLCTFSRTTRSYRGNINVMHGAKFAKGFGKSRTVASY